MAILWSVFPLLLAGCGSSFSGGDFSSTTPASEEPAYYGTPTAVSDPVVVTIPVKFYYRQLDFTPGSITNGLGSVVSAENAAPVSFAEFHIYDASNVRVQQGETNTSGQAVFAMPKTAGSYILKVFSRSLNSYLKVSVLEDIYANTPYSISKSFEITSADISAGTKDLSSEALYAHADEAISAKVEGAAFNIMFNVLLANEYIRRNISKNGSTPGVPESDTKKWWVAEKVTIYWKAGFNPYTYFGRTSPLSFYAPGDRKLYILGGSSGDVTSSDTDHFDDSIVLHEYAHFLEDVYGNSQSPGGTHTGQFVLDPRLAWSEGWANYFQSAVLSGADAYGSAAAEDRIPTNKKFSYYIDTYGYKGAGNTSGVNINFNLSADGSLNTEPDNVSSDLPGTGIFRELSVSRTLYKATRNTSAQYASGKSGGGVAFQNIWLAFAGENTTGNDTNNPATYSLAKSDHYPAPNAGLFNWLLAKNGVVSAQWDNILSEEKQTKTTADYAYLLADGSCTFTFNGGTPEIIMYPKDPVRHSHQQMNNDFFLFYHDGSASNTLSMTYSTSGSKVLNLDLILYKPGYIYFEDDYWYAGQSSTSIAKQSRSATGTSESVSLSGLAAGFYFLNVKINAYGKTSSDLNGVATYQIYKNGVQQCGTERP